MKRAHSDTIDEVENAHEDNVDPFAYDTTGTIELTYPNILMQHQNKLIKSDTVYIGNIPFYAAVRREVDEQQKVYLVGYVCVAVELDSVPLNWKVNLKSTFRLHATDNESEGGGEVHTLTLTQTETCYCADVVEWPTLLEKKSAFIKDGAARILVTIVVESSDGFIKKRRIAFEKSPLTDACLVIGDEEVHVNRGFLATCSPYFYKLFHGDFADKNQERITLKDLDFDEFTHFLEMLQFGEVDKDSVKYLMKLADLYDCEMVMNKCAAFLRTTKDMTLTDRLVLADEYHRFDVATQCMSEIKTINDAIQIAKSTKIQKASDHLKATFFHKFCRFD